MDLSCQTGLLLSNQSFLESVSEDVLDVLRSGKNAQYLDVLSRLALNPTYTSIIFITHEAIFVEICSRWQDWLRSSSMTDPLAAVAAFARIIPFAPHLSAFVEELLHRQQFGILSAFASQNTMALMALPDQSLNQLLLALCRLLVFDNNCFASLISPAQLQPLLSHAQQSIRYLAIKILCLYLHASDSAMVNMVNRYCSKDKIPGAWEDKHIDYAFFTLWEEKRLKQLGQQLETARRTHLFGKEGNKMKRELEPEDLSMTTAFIGDVLVPRLSKKPIKSSTIVKTATFKQNARLLANAINGIQCIVVTGLAGAGKSSLIRYAARELGKGDSMVTLHLNEQTDAKLLIGMYTSDDSPGSFTWRPGVLTKAVTEGRWVMIEDLDRAPKEILSTILPLLERRELFVPHWGESIQAAPGFKIIATIRSHANLKGDEVIPGINNIGFRHWLRVPLLFPSNQELVEILLNRFPILHAYVPEISRVYNSLTSLGGNDKTNPRASFSPGKPIGPQDLLKWCGRLENLLLTAGIRSSNDRISETLSDMIFVEAVDCFAGVFPDGPLKSAIISQIAQELNVPAERAQYCLEVRRPEYVVSDTKIQIGRIALSKSSVSHRSNFLTQHSGKSPFAMTIHVLHVLESVAVAVRMAEPCLLVGETGTGKTTMIQQLANSLGYRLTVVNLSQQSEAGDLLGGYKPLNIRALAVPMKEEFDDLFENTFSVKRNRQYTETIGRAVSKGRWSRAVALWQEALRMVNDLSDSTALAADEAIIEPQAKRRRLDSSKYQKLRNRWEKFAADVHKFQMQIASGSKGFVFSFVEGNIVKAARNGEWVLLDEINLASPDTLESLADLLYNGSDESPSLLLSETGDTQRIEVHKDFRIFGAMNPATDIGKRDLPVSLRSRFSEIYIESPDKGFDNLLSIVHAYLGNHSNSDVRAASDVSSLYLEIKRLADNNQLADGAGQKPHYSLRTLTRTMIYVMDIAPMYGLRRALFEGFSMSFLTLLNKESEMLLLPLIDKYILGSYKNRRALLRQIPRAPQDDRRYVQFQRYWIARGADLIDEQPHYIITPFVEQNLLNLVRATSTRRFPVLLQGPTSSGKTSMIEYLARISGNRFLRINNHEHTDLQEYLGSYISGPDGRLQYQEGILVNALREGYWIVLDELNLAPTDVLEALNRLLDDNKELLIPETQQLIRPHQNFMLFATQNPPGMYGGRKVLSRAFRNRFLELHFDDIPEDELEVILRERSQIAPSFCSKIVAVYKKLSILRQQDRLFEQKNSFATLRDLFRWALRDADDREQLAVNGFLLLAERVRNIDERAAVKKTIEDVMKVKIDESRIYNPSSLLLPSASILWSIQEVVWTSSMRRLYILVTQALKRNEPVLLVGETGSGKTTICQVISKIMNIGLHIVNAHQNLETGDLIGSQRPVRNRALIEAQLRADLSAILRNQRAYKTDSREDLAALFETYDTLLQKSSLSISKEERNSVEQKRAKASALFEWSDGSLVHAMRNGQLFLLDEISLADDSVLERLNSVLEPGRKLLLAEKGATDTLVTATEGFQFIATMNPGGDYGKRELSPALRNRFTEIWVPHATDRDEILEIVQARLSAPWVNHASPMVDFAAWYGARYNFGAPSLSIRELLAWIQFVNNYRGPDPYLALLHGAAMVYIDGLGANPAAKVSVPEAEIVNQRRACLTELSGIFHYPMTRLYDENVHYSLEEAGLTLGPFKLETVGRRFENSTYSLEAPTAKRNALKIVRALQLQKPILIEGSPGVGKTSLVIILAQLLGIPLTRINLSEQTDLMDLFGSDVPIDGADAGQFAWRDAPFLRAMQKGEWVLLDEMNLASQAVLEGLNACLDHRGQVYVSELDQTFSRHPKFTVFAAQNPHHQGGGRKGLPASFVNRFTVIYADSFTSADLTIICGQSYPGCSAELIKSLTNCVTDISQICRTDSRFASRGAPWEINLRDLLRWLHLATSRKSLMSAGDATDFQHLLFFQRFRSSDDVASIVEILENYLPQTNQKPRYYHGTSPSYVQVGLGLMARDSILRPVPAERAKISHTKLQLIESVMLCVQNNWPCLLVGPSGCGKTSLIFHVASQSGADVVNLPLNADMDTTDLVGGYEQVDIQRESTSLVRRLTQIVRKELIDQFVCSIKPNSDIACLEKTLQATRPDLSQILALTRKLEIDDFGISDECDSIIQRSFEATKARFEWVDGILVKALKQGQWLVLDNANLCSLSVLDRLNSLLEPNGVLNINEHRSSNGCATNVTPHPNFRLFITMDPRHGELSRAMRNRCIELYLPAEPSSVMSIEMNSACESSISRFQILGSIDWSTSDRAHVSDLSLICLDHLAITDYKLARRWQTEISKGLTEMSEFQQDLLESHLSIQYQVFGSDGSIMHRVQKSYEQLGHNLDLNLDFRNMQTINPLNNHVLVSLTTRHRFSANLRFLGNVFELLVNIHTFKIMLASVYRNMSPKPPSQWSRLERSLVSSQSHRLLQDSTQPLGKFLKEMGLFLQHFLDDDNFDPKQEEQETLNLTNSIISYLWDMLDLGMLLEFDEGAFQVYLAIGKSIVAQGDGSTEETKTLTKKLGSMLSLFNAAWQMSTGLSMEILWNMFKPSTAKSTAELDTRIRAEKLAERFDALKWGIGISIRDLDLVRHSIVRMYNTITSIDAISDDQFKDIQEAVDNLERHPYLSQAAEPNLPHFAAEFEGLCQYSAVTETTRNSDRLSVLELLASRPTKFLMGGGYSSSSWSLLSKIQNCTGIHHQSNSLIVLRNTLPCSVIAGIENISEVSLRCLASLRCEMNSMAETVVYLSEEISHNQHRNLNSIIARLHMKIYEAHENQLDPLSLERCRDYMDQYSQRLTEEFQYHDVPVLDIKPETPRSNHLSQILEEYFNPSLQNLQKGLKQGSEGLAGTASAWILFFTGLLYLYVPDRPFDPALKPFVERARHIKRKVELQLKLSALEEFEMKFSGQNSSFRTQLVREQMSHLGNKPPRSLIARPQVSELGQLQGEFNNIISSVMQRSPTIHSLQSLFRGDTSKLQEIQNLRSNLSQAVSRLSAGYRVYDDVTKPLVSMLQGLDVGLATASLVANPISPNCNEIQHLCESTPFLGMTAGYFTKTTFEGMKIHQPQRVDPRLCFLDAVVLSRSINQNLEPGTTQAMHEVLMSFYKDWKERLEYDQQEEVAKSSMYRYRGAEIDDEDANENDFLDIFPNFNEESEKSNKAVKPPSNPHTQALNIAQFQRKMFGSTKSTADQILSMLVNATKSISKSWTSESSMTTCQVPAESLMCGVIWSLISGNDHFNSSSGSEKTYNFYVDANLGEVQKLILVVNDIQSRFMDLADVWPEHAIIKDILQSSSELMALRHVEPIAKILTKAEQVHKYLNEWQIVASKEYSALNLYDQLTTLLVNWRRLELSTWARLLDMEDKKCNDEADSWWFLAYEVIIAVPLSMINSREDLQMHVEQLVATLGDFVATTSVGQYSQRLRLIECFKSYVDLLAKEEPSMKAVQKSLANFLGFYTRFEKAIEEFLHQGRLKLQKDMKEILLLASWKDININALRESAKRSHHKLFKVVRKYRALLTQPADKIVARGIPERLDIIGPSPQSHTIPLVLVIDIQAFEKNKQHLPDWNLKPARFQNPLGITKNMHRMVQVPPHAFDSLLWLESYADNLTENIKILQREKPSKATKDNINQAKHLKTRKKKLLADSLKALRHMGFRSNLSADALAQQKSTAIILAQSPAHHSNINETTFMMAEFYFHQLLHVMPQVREKYRNHSEDLSYGEISRCIGYLESMLSTVLKKRARSVESRANIDHVQRSIELMQNLCLPQAYTVHKKNKNAQDADKIKAIVIWLPGIIEAGCIIVKKHADLGGIDSTIIMEALTGWKNKMTELVEHYKQLPNLPVQLSSSVHEETYDQAKASLNDLKTDLRSLSEENRNVGFVLKQIEIWTENEMTSKNSPTDGELSISLLEFDHTISKILDSILVAVQCVQEISPFLPKSEEEIGWLMQDDMALARCLRALHVQEINSLLEVAMSKVNLVEAQNGNIPEAVGALCAMAMPIIQQYHKSLSTLLDRSVKSYRLLCNLATISAQSFCQIASQGFCNPTEDSDPEAGKSEKLEGGTGLGEGEGVEDISKDVQDDEDLSELAQGANKDQDKSEIENQQDAINMDQEELEGDMGDASGRDEESESGSDDAEDDVDEETGDVDDLDPSAVDEKLWDGSEDDMEKEKGSQAAGKKKQNEQVAADADQKTGSDSTIAEEEDQSMDGIEESEKAAQEETEKLDNHLEEGQNLELPEDMDLDNGDQSSVSSLGENEANDVSENEQDDTGEQEANQADNNVEHDEPTEEVTAKEEELQVLPEDINETENDVEHTQQAGSPVDTEPADSEKDIDDSLLRDHSNKENVDMDDINPNDSQGFGADDRQQIHAQKKQENRAQGKEGEQGHATELDDSQATNEEGQLAQTARASTDARNEDVQSGESSSREAFKKLGDALEKWHRQQRQIQDSRDTGTNDDRPMEAIESVDQDFEHLADEEVKADTQALGATTHDQAYALNEQAFESQMQDQLPDFLPDEPVAENIKDEDTLMEDFEDDAMRRENRKEKSRPGALIIENTRAHEYANANPASADNGENDINRLDNNLSTIHLQLPNTGARSASEALRLWTHYSTIMHPLSLTLTEQLRLILAPTLATKMRGDFRTGKRLNIKRIIPYIASSYKRDKIWMRRSVPSKRAYQILLAVDDSKSMGESSAGHLAFETLALVAKSLSMLEVGEICVVGFGAEVHVAHEFDKPFSIDAGAEIFRQFTFRQERTDVKKLVEQSITLFHEARNKSTRAGADDLWQLELIISDGVCEEHEAIRRLVRRAQEARIVIVFVIVDAGKGESILDMSQAVFEPDDAGGAAGADMEHGRAGTKLRIKRYLDGFPFAYYLVVRDVKELPGVLATALRQWFAEVVESG